MASTDDAKKKAKPAPPRNERLAQMEARINAAKNKPPVSPQQFFQEAWVELKKTSWPTRDVLVKSTTVVLAFVVSVAIWVALWDLVLGRVFQYITGR